MTHACLVSVLLLLASCASAPPGVQQQQALPGQPLYNGDVTIDPAAGTLSANWRISFIPAPNLADSAAFLLNRGLRIASVTGRRVSSFSQNDSAGWNRVTVRFTNEAPSGAPMVLDIRYAGKPLFSEDSINGIRSNWIELGVDAAWHPVFANYDQSIRGEFRLHLPGEWQAVASGTTHRVGRRIDIKNTIPLIDLAFSAAPALRSSSSAAATVYHVNADTAAVRRVLETTASCAADLNRRYGARNALPQVKIMMAPRNGPGYARTNYIVITDVAKLPPDALSRFLCHELAHFWSSGAIASGPENWLNEAFAEFVALRYVRATHGVESYQKIMDQMRTVSEKQPAIWKAGFNTRPTGIVAYRKAPYLLHRLEERIGATAMEKILERRMVERVTTTSRLIQIVREVVGAEHAAWFEEELGK